MNSLLLGPPRTRYYMLNSVAYTEDRIKVQRLTFSAVPLKLPESALNEHFSRFGQILKFQLGRDFGSYSKTKLEPCIDGGEVLYANPVDAAKALNTRTHRIDGINIRVEPSYTWRQPDACGSYRIQELAPILKLNDDCWFHILKYLPLRDKVRFARTCQSFRAVYQMATARQYTTVNTRQFDHMTRWDIQGFYQLSGEQIRVLECDWPLKESDVRFGFIGVYCQNLVSLSLGSKVLTKESMLQMPTSIESLDLSRCLRVDDLPTICKHFTKLRKLNMPESIVDDTICQSLVKENCCPSLEVLQISSFKDGKCEILAQLPSLKSLTIHSTRGVFGAGTDLTDRLVEHQAEQLESLEVDCPNTLSRRQLSQMPKLTGLRTLILPFWYSVSDDALKEFENLKRLQRICLNYNGGSGSGILELFSACPKLSHLSIVGIKIPATKLVEGIIARVIHEKSVQELQREIPVEMGLLYDLSATGATPKSRDFGSGGLVKMVFNYWSGLAHFRPERWGA